jgi:acetyl esterase/lipase
MTSAPASIATTRHTYGTDPEHFGELRLPAGSGPFPAIVYLHGGGYRSAVTLAGAAGICAALANEGYAVWSIEYRRIGNGGGWPMTFDDVTAASQFLKTLADHLAIDLERAIVAGQSAGGQLALWLGNRSAAGHGDLPKFRGVLALAPASDLQATARGGNGTIVELLGGSPEQVPDRYAATSPVELAPIGLPQLIVHGTADNTVPYALSQTYVETARQKGDQVELVTIDGADHLDLWNPASAAFPQVVAAARPFLSRVCTL